MRRRTANVFRSAPDRANPLTRFVLAIPLLFLLMLLPAAGRDPGEKAGFGNDSETLTVTVSGDASGANATCVPVGTSLALTATAGGVDGSEELTQAIDQDGDLLNHGSDNPLYASTQPAAGQYTFTATAGFFRENPVEAFDFCTDSKDVTVVAVEKVVDDANPTTQATTIYVPIGKSFTARAIASPAGARWPDSNPTWTLTKPDGSSVTMGTVPTATTHPSVPGDYVLTAKCGTSEKSITVTAWKLEITDMSDNVITGPQKTVVGKKVSLKGRITPSIAPTTRNWTISGTTDNSAISNYQRSNTKATITPLDEVSNPSVSFYWIAGGAGKHASHKVQVGSDTAEASVEYEVLRPEGTLKSVTTPLVPKVGVRLNLWLSFGDGFDGEYGITWTGKIKTMADEAGKISLVQVGCSDWRKTRDTGEKIRRTSGTDFLADDPVPYANEEVAVADNATAEIVNSDTPGIGLERVDRKGAIDDQYRLYLTYKPDGSDSIWVTLARLDWHCKGSAVSTDGSNWTEVDGGQSSSVNPAGSDNSELPTWKFNLHSLEWKEDNTNP